MDVTVVGSGPNGLAAAVICARAGLAVRVVEAQPTPGGGARTRPDPEFPGVLHDICSAVHPLALASPFFAEFDLRGARRASWSAPEVSYANPLPDRPAAVGIPLTGAHLRRARRRRVVATALRTADRTRRRCTRVLPRRQAVSATGPADHGADRPAGAGPGQPGVGSAPRRGRSRAVHRRWRARDFDDAIAGQQRRRADARHRWRTRRAGRCRSAGRRRSPTR